MSLKTMKFPKASVNKNTSPSFSEMTDWGRGWRGAGGGKKMNTITLFNGLKGCHVKEGADCWCWVLRRAEWGQTCGKVVGVGGGGELSALYKERFPGLRCSHVYASEEWNRRGGWESRQQHFPLINSSHGVSFAYLNPQPSIRIVIPPFHG